MQMPSFNVSFINVGHLYHNVCRPAKRVIQIICIDKSGQIPIFEMVVSAGYVWSTRKQRICCEVFILHNQIENALQLLIQLDLMIMLER